MHKNQKTVIADSGNSSGMWAYCIQALTRPTRTVNKMIHKEKRKLLRLNTGVLPREGRKLIFNEEK